MNSQPQNNKRVCTEPKNPIEYEVYKWDERNHRFVKVKIQKKFNQNQITYLYEGRILRSLLLQDQQDENNEMFYNLEQIENLDWKGTYGRNNKKFGMWNAYWKGEKLQDVGGYYKNGKKVGLWNELFKNYSCQAEVLEIGCYKANKKVGRWKYRYEKVEIGGGQYFSQDEVNNLKIGQWIDLDDEFRFQKQVTYNGEYKIGKKVGRWDICFRNNQDDTFKQIVL